MAQKKHFDATNATQKKISRLIGTVYEQSRKNTLNAIFAEKKIIGS